MKKGLSREGLKAIACVSMLFDHIGALLVDNIWLRLVGRLAFPIYCFLLVEGIHHSHDLKKYQTRLILAALLAEIPFDLAFSGGLDFESCSVMVTLLLGFWTVMAVEKGEGIWIWAAVLSAFLAAEVLRADYAGIGVLMILLFDVTREHPGKRWLQALGMVILNWMGSDVTVFGIGIPQQLFAVLALIPIFLYDGRKLTGSRAVQGAFYLFYPVHLLILYGLSVIYL